SSAFADRTACESLVTTSMRQAAATAKMRSRPRCGPCRALSLAADMKAALLYDQPRAGNSVQDSAQLAPAPTAYRPRKVDSALGIRAPTGDRISRRQKELSAGSPVQAVIAPLPGTGRGAESTPHSPPFSWTQRL